MIQFVKFHQFMGNRNSDFYEKFNGKFKNELFPCREDQSALGLLFLVNKFINSDVDGVLLSKTL